MKLKRRKLLSHVSLIHVHLGKRLYNVPFNLCDLTFITSFTSTFVSLLHRHRTTVLYKVTSPITTLARRFSVLCSDRYWETDRIRHCTLASNRLLSPQSNLPLNLGMTSPVYQVSFEEWLNGFKCTCAWNNVARVAWQRLKEQPKRFQTSRLKSNLRSP